VIPIGRPRRERTMKLILTIGDGANVVDVEGCAVVGLAAGYDGSKLGDVGSGGGDE